MITKNGEGERRGGQTGPPHPLLQPLPPHPSAPLRTKVGGVLKTRRGREGGRRGRRKYGRLSSRPAAIKPTLGGGKLSRRHEAPSCSEYQRVWDSQNEPWKGWILWTPERCTSETPTHAGGVADEIQIWGLRISAEANPPTCNVRSGLRSGGRL